MLVSAPFLKQYGVTVAVNLCSLSVGMAIGWTSPGLVKLRDANQTALSRAITEEEGSKIVSLSCLSAVIAVFAAAYLMDHMGRKASIILAAVLKVGAGILQTFGTEVWVVLMTRAIVGGLDAIDVCVIPAYASEVASKEIRGSLGVIFNIFIAAGIVLMLSIGPFCSYTALNIVYSGVTLLAIIPLALLPESPYFLYSKGRQDETIKVLTLLRGSEELVKEEIKQYSLENNGEKVNRWKLFKSRAFLKPLAISLLLNMGGQLMGHNVIMSYLQTILQLSDTNVKPEIASTVIGCVSVVASISTFFTLDKFGRKPILAITLTGAAMGLLGLGTFFKIQERATNTEGFLSYLPLLSLILFYFCQASGFSSISCIITSELFDGPARATGISAVTLIIDIVLFLIGQFFITITSAIGFSTVFWVFSVNGLVTCLFVLLFVPETKGRTFLEIQQNMGTMKEKHGAPK